MDDSKPVPTLSSDGWVTSTSMKADYLLSYFFTSEYSSSYLSYGDISSFPWLLQNYKLDLAGLREETKVTLEKLYGRYFPSVEVQVATKLEEGSKYAITIVVIVTDVNGKEFSVGRVGEVLESKMVKVQKINNYGADE